jgi:hypothetical protein
MRNTLVVVEGGGSVVGKVGSEQRLVSRDPGMMGEFGAR